MAVSGVSRPTPKKPSASPNANVILHAEASIVPLSANRNRKGGQEKGGQVSVGYGSLLETNIVTMAPGLDVVFYHGHDASQRRDCVS